MLSATGRILGRVGATAKSVSAHFPSLFQQQQIRLLRRVPNRKLPVPKTEKRLDIVIVGAPNAGKSVLLNTLVKAKLAATSRKRHTTRNEILGVFNHRNTQLAFYDTPGFVAKTEANKTDVKTLREISADTLGKADVALLVVDASRCSGTKYQDAFAEMAQLALQSSKLEIILILNKVDLVEPKVLLLDITRELVSLINGIKHGEENAHLSQLDTTTFMISALQDDGVIDLKNYLISIAQPKPWRLSKSNGLTNWSMEERVEEIVLEMLMENTHDEIPYIADIECTTITALSDTRCQIDVNIGVDSPAQQRILVGHQGRTLVKLRQAAAAELEKILGKTVILYLWIKRRDAPTAGDA